ncbi:solute carrier family 40 member 1-like [Watersipora subatra]|uniref:solute carrier family 40 member 1-like n=1 Tax=Watersipora subatra TaxID=2589382 RepID=UPI00355C9393
MEADDKSCPTPTEECEEKRTFRDRLSTFLHSTSASIYVSHFLSSWGDRMWMFAVGVYLSQLSPTNLRLVASYGFAVSISAVLLGAIIGDAVDKYPRLKVARTVLAFQNVLVAMCAILVSVVYAQQEYIYSETWRSGLCEAGIITLAVLASLFSTALKISIEKDWISVICEGDSKKLARLSSITRAIDQVTNISAPALTGFIISSFSVSASAIFVAIWNVCSIFVEYGLLQRIYRKVPELAVKTLDQADREIEGGVNESATEGEMEQKIGCEVEYLESEKAKESPDPVLHSDVEKTSESVEQEKDMKATSLRDITPETNPEPNRLDDDGPVDHNYNSTDLSILTQRNSSKSLNNADSKCTAVCKKLFSVFFTLKTGWSVYFSYRVKYAGMGLAALYMTVLGFDNITIGYANSQGATPAAIGGMMSAGAVTGIVATFVYPKMRNSIGVERAGLVGSAAQILCLLLSLLSVWVPGSPFNLSPQTSENVTNGVTEPINLTEYGNLLPNVTVVSPVEPSVSKFSLVFLMAGIITSRFGLWTFDLSVNQLLIERVNQSQRGIVNGVQSSLNMLMDLLKYILVIAVPDPRHFGILICLSFLFIILGGVSFFIYCGKMGVKLFGRLARGSQELRPTIP